VPAFLIRSERSRYVPLIPGTAQRNEAKEEKLEKDCRYRHRAHGRGLRDSIRRKNVAHGFDPRIAYGQLFEGVDAGHLDASRNIETLGLLVGQLAYGSGFGNRVALRAYLAS
jgi:hypothetical protein